MAVITFPQNIDVNLQVGDSVYKLNGTAAEYLGVCTAINGNELTHDGITNSVAGDYILFQKNIIANNNNLKGYYSEVTLKVNSATNKELFAVNSQINLSSK
jgi:hypothetical protein